MYSDETKEILLATLDLPTGSGAVEDVQINGTSITKNGVAVIPLASTSIEEYGLVMLGSGFRVGSTGKTNIWKASTNDIDSRSNDYKAIVPSNLAYAVKSIETSVNASEQLTPEEQTNAQIRLGILSVEEVTF